MRARISALRTALRADLEAGHGLGVSAAHINEACGHRPKSSWAHQAANAEAGLNLVQFLTAWIPLTGGQHAARLLAESAGLRVYDPESVPTPASGIAQLGREVGEAMSAICESLADGKLTEIERRRCVTEIEDVLRVAAATRDMIEHYGERLEDDRENA